jgi:hypothetical protein
MMAMKFVLEQFIVMGHQAYIVFEYKKTKNTDICLHKKGFNMFNNIMNNNVEVMHKDK